MLCQSGVWKKGTGSGGALRFSEFPSTFAGLYTTWASVLEGAGVTVNYKFYIDASGNVYRRKPNTGYQSLFCNINSQPCGVSADGVFFATTTTQNNSCLGQDTLHLNKALWCGAVDCATTVQGVLISVLQPTYPTC